MNYAANCDSAHPVTSLDCPTENTAKSIKGAAVLLGVQLGNVHQQRSPGIACLDVPHNFIILFACVQPLNLQFGAILLTIWSNSWHKYARDYATSARGTGTGASLVA